MKILNTLRILLLAMTVVLPLCAKAQDKVEFVNLKVKVQMPEHEEISESLLSSLQDKLYEAVSLNALGSTDNDSRFVVLPVVNVVSKNVTSSIPSQFVAEVEIVLYFVDNNTKTILSQVVIVKKAMDDSESKAVAKALKSLQARDKKIKRLFDKGKENLANYFASHADEVEVVEETNTDWVFESK
ncbi:MAG: hypothetical protein Q4F69_01125 [Bacteroidia bacterium]|nr:hypothetical protein [Bacteroidia bacterium]